MTNKVILLWSQDDGALYLPANVDDPKDPWWSKLEVTLNSEGVVSLTPKQIACQQNDIAHMLIEAKKARFV